MGLRALLQDLQGVTQATQGAANAAGSLREQLAMQQYAQQLPGIIQSGDVGQLAGAAAQAQDLPTLRSLIQNQTKFQPKLQPASEEYIKAQEAATGRKLPRGLSKDDLNSVIASGMKTEESRLKNQNIDESFDLRRTKFLQDSSDSFSKDLNKIDDELKDKKVKLEGAIKDFVTKPNAGRIRSLGTALARASGQNGVLTEPDVAAYIPKSLAGQVRDLSNYLQENADAIIKNPALVQDLQSQADSILGRLDSLYKKRLDEHFVVGVKNRSQLVKSKEFRQGLDEWASRLGYEAPEIQDGKVSLKRKASEIPADSRLGKAMSMANSIPDGTRKQQALNALGKFSNESFTAEKAAQFEQLIKSFGGK